MNLRLCTIALLVAALLGACGGDEPSPATPDAADATVEEADHPENAADPAAIGLQINTLLDRIVSTYEAGEAEAAAELAAVAYLENYELIEHDIEEVDEELNEELELLLGTELRAHLKDGAPLSDIKELVATAKGLLAEALEALEAG